MKMSELGSSQWEEGYLLGMEESIPESVMNTPLAHASEGPGIPLIGPFFRSLQIEKLHYIKLWQMRF